MKNISILNLELQLKTKTSMSTRRKCQLCSIVYKYVVTAPKFPKKVYIGLTEKTFKTRFNSHAQSFEVKGSKTIPVYEKYEIIFYPIKDELLNKRSEQFAKCRHTNKFFTS